MSVTLCEPELRSTHGDLSRPSGARRLLLVSYHFPPVGGAGVQRPVKFVKYLHEFGWQVSVLAASNPSVPVFDESLLADIPDGTTVLRTRTWEPGYRFKQSVGAKAAAAGRPSLRTRCKTMVRGALRSAAGMLLQPDAQSLWIPTALKAATRLLKDVPHDAIVATAPPYSNFVLGSLLKSRFGLPLVLDYRDEWDLSSQYLENSQRDVVSRVVQTRLQRHLLRRADAVVATTEASTARLAQRATEAGSRATSACVYNGFDDDDIAHALTTDSQASTRRRFRLIYTGTLWNLTSVEPLVLAVEQLRRERPELLDALELVFVGRKTPQQLALLERLCSTGCHLEIEDYCDHKRAVQLMAESDALCLLLSDVEGADRVVPAKLFEYFALGRPMLAIAPLGETAELIQSVQPEAHHLPGDVAGIARWIAGRVDAQSRQAFGTQRTDAVERFSRRQQTGRLAELLDGLVTQR